jgi:hypothetical protein
MTPGQLVAIEGGGSALATASPAIAKPFFDDPKGRERELRDKAFNARAKLEDALVAAQVYRHVGGDTEIEKRVRASFDAQYRLEDFLDRRAKGLVRALARIAEESTANPANRVGSALEAIYGHRKASRRNPVTLSDCEGKLVADYRRLGDDDRKLLRILMDRLASTGAADGAR